jgi:hypothetical protein
LACFTADVRAGQASPLSPAELRGRELYRRGVSSAGRPVSVSLNDEPTTLTFACAGCHGRDGRGRSEGGLRPADVRWSTLSRPLAEAVGARPGRPAYDPARLRRAVTMGFDSGGRRLDPVMPRYHLQREDADDLLAYLLRLGSLADPGLTPERLGLGLLLPAGREGREARRVAEGWAADLAARGGLYARRVEVVFFDDPAALVGVSEEHEPFALVGSSSEADFEPLAAWVARREVPWLHLAPSGDGPPAFQRWIVGVGTASLAAVLARLEHALARAGRDVSRESLVEVLRSGARERR